MSAIYLERDMHTQTHQWALQLGCAPLQATLLANRLHHLSSIDDLQRFLHPKLSDLQSLDDLHHIDVAANRVVDAMQAQQTIVLASDYDSDGISAAAIGALAFEDYFHYPDLVTVISERQQGYGLNDGAVDTILELPHVGLVISADQGSSDQARIARLKSHGIDVVVTDHHQIPTDGIPSAAVACVNPQQDGCHYDKAVAGVYVLFLLLAKVRQVLIERQLLTQDAPTLKGLLDIVAIGTVADCVDMTSLNNRVVVSHGLAQSNQSQRPFWHSIRQKIKHFTQFTAKTIGFEVSTRINAASRVGDAKQALFWLLSKSDREADRFLHLLEQNNQRRKQKQADLMAQAEQAVSQLDKTLTHSIVIQVQGETGVQGIVANRLAEQSGKPCMVFTPTDDGILSGSARSPIQACHIQQWFVQLAQTLPDTLLNHGGHQAAGGASIYADQFPAFQQAFEQLCQQISADIPQPTLQHDGELSADQLHLDTWAMQQQLEPFGQKFPAPQYVGTFTIQHLRWVGPDQQHAQLTLQLTTARPTQNISAIYFFANKADASEVLQPNAHVRMIYQLQENHFRSQRQLQLHILSHQPITA